MSEQYFSAETRKPQDIYQNNRAQYTLYNDSSAERLRSQDILCKRPTQQILYSDSSARKLDHLRIEARKLGYKEKNYKAEFALFAFLFIATLLKPRPDITSQQVVDPSLKIPSLADMPSMYIEDTYNPDSTKDALDDLVDLQNPDGSVRNEKNGTLVRPMDTALASIAFAMIKDGEEGEDEYYLNRAEEGADWLVTHETKESDPEKERYGTLLIDDGQGKRRRVLLDGSFWGEYDSSGNHYPPTISRRARGEAVGITLIALGSVNEKRPGYLFKELIDSQGHVTTPLQAMEDMVEFLASPLMLSRDGRFYHSPEFHRHFGEEQARDREGLYAAAQAFEEAAQHYPEKAQYYQELAYHARYVADQNFAAVLEYGADIGQPLDPPAIGIWGQSDPSAKDQSVSQTELALEGIALMEELGLVTHEGIENWDMQQLSNPDFLQRLRYRIYGQTLGYAPLIDFGNAKVSAKDIGGAEEISDMVSNAQTLNGSIPMGRLPLINIPFGVGEAGYNESRLVILNARIGHAEMQHPVKASHPNKFKELFNRMKGWTMDRVRADQPEKTSLPHE